MTEEDKILKEVTGAEYKYGFTTNVESDTIPKGLNKDVIRLISKKKEEPQWLLEHRLKAFESWKKMEEPDWANIKYKKPNYQDIIYYAAPKQKKEIKSLDELDPEMKKRLLINLEFPLTNKKKLAGVAVDFVMDSVSVATSFKDKLSELGIIFVPLVRL